MPSFFILVKSSERSRTEAATDVTAKKTTVKAVCLWNEFKILKGIF